MFFTDTNGGDNPTPCRIRCLQNYTPLQQLSSDLAENEVADYNWITPDQYNDMHSDQRGFNGLTGDAADQAGRRFVGQIVPVIMASSAYKNRRRSSFGGTNPNRTGRRVITRTTSNTRSARLSSLRVLIGT